METNWILTGSTLYGGPCGLFGSMLCSFVPGLLYQLIVRNILQYLPTPIRWPILIPSNKNMKNVSKDLTALAKFIDEGLIAPCVTKEYKLHDRDCHKPFEISRGAHRGLDYSSSNTGEKNLSEGKLQ